MVCPPAGRALPGDLRWRDRREGQGRGQVRNTPFYVVMGVTTAGEREILGIWAGDGAEGASVRGVGGRAGGGGGGGWAAGEREMVGIWAGDGAEGASIRALAARYGVGRATVRTALSQAEPPPRKTPVRVSPRLEEFKAAIDAMLFEDVGAPIGNDVETATRSNMSQFRTSNMWCARRDSNPQPSGL